MYPTYVKAGENLQAALNLGGDIVLEKGATYEGSYTIPSNTRLFGLWSNIHSSIAGPAINIKPGTRNISVVLREATTKWNQSCVLVGTNDSKFQSKLEDVPDGIDLTVTIPSFRGKHAFNINGTNVRMINCNVFDAYDPGGQDSQAIGILNTPGKIIVLGGTFEAASENIMLGGDPTGIPSVLIKDVYIEGVILQKRLEWKGSVPVKNNFELKDGQNIVLRNALLRYSWQSGQTGYSIQLTPRNGKAVRNVLFDNITVRGVGGIINILGVNDKEPSEHVTDVVFNNIDAIASKASYGGYGIFMYAQAEPRNITVQNSKFTGDGTTLTFDKGKVWTLEGNKIEGGPFYGFKFINNDMTLASYGFRPWGNSYSKDWQITCPDGVIDNNIFRNADKRNIPNLPSTNKFV